MGFESHVRLLDSAALPFAQAGSTPLEQSTKERTMQGRALILALVFGPPVLFHVAGLLVVGRRPVTGLTMLGVGTSWMMAAALFGIARQ